MGAMVVECEGGGTYGKFDDMIIQYIGMKMCSGTHSIQPSWAAMTSLSTIQTQSELASHNGLQLTQNEIAHLGRLSPKTQSTATHSYFSRRQAVDLAAGKQYEGPGRQYRSYRSPSQRS